MLRVSELRIEEPIRPPQVVPIIDMPPEGDDLDSIDRRIPCDLGKNFVRRWVTGATLEGQELKDDGGGDQ